MSFEISKSRPEIRQPVRKQEVLNMLKQLEKDPDNLTAKIDMATANVRRYSKELGYTVRTRKIDNNNSFVWIVSK